ncbi:MAG: hypothetical protein HYX90_02870 [Chloroflexi bacterium]|nr:hypothetical protein [Chloroflexota bacterium]
MAEKTMTANHIDEAMLEQIDKIQLSPRLSKERQQFFDHDVEITGDRAVLVMESWKESEGDVLDIRWAKLVKTLAERLPVVIFQGQLVVGSQTKLLRGADPWVEYEAPNLLDTMGKNRHEVRQSAARISQCSEEEWVAVNDAVSYFAGKTPVDLMFKSMEFLYGDWPEEFEKAKGVLRHGRYNQVAPVPDWYKLYSLGLRPIIEQAQAGIETVRSGAEPDAKKAWFWQAVIIVCQAVIDYSKRYAKLAAEMARDEADPQRRAELESIAEACTRVPEYSARNLQEAVQARIVWGHAMMWCRPNLLVDNSGRIDQDLWPYFSQDIRSGRLTLDQAGELIGALLSDVARRDGVKSMQRGQFAQGTLISNVVIGGLTKEGKDACNELTYLAIHMAGLLKLAEPHYTLRVNVDTPKWIMRKSLETNRLVGGGQPQFMSDNRIIDYFVKYGETLEDARDWIAHGCINPVPGGKNGARVQLRNAGHLNMPLIVDLLLHNGVAPMTGKRLGVESGDPRSFTSFDQVWRAYRAQLEFMVPRLNAMLHVAQRVDEQRMRFPLWSVFSPGCLEKGQDFLTGGTTYRTWDWQERGHVDAADSLMAIKKLVFDEKKLTMSELVEALDGDYAGPRGEEVRRMCLGAPKFGNGIEEVDMLVRQSGELMAELVGRHKNPMGGQYTFCRNGLSWHYYGGKGVGALPNGRKAGEPLNDGSLSPMRGADRKGITGVLRSALTAQFMESRATVLNQRFPAALMQSTESIEKLANLTQTFLTSGGTHIQYNILDRKVLLDARQHPELYKDLIVRVAGYSAYWVHLTPEVQDDIIARTEQSI